MAPALGEQIGEIGGTIRAMLGLTRHSRIRDQLRGTIELYQLIGDSEELGTARANLASVINRQTDRLVDASSATGRQWNWGSAFLCWVLTGGMTVAAWYLAPEWGQWWGVVLMVLVGFLGSLFLIASFGVLLEKKSASA